MSETEKKSIFIESAKEASDGKDGNLEFTCPLCGGYAIGVRKSYFGSILASCSCCFFQARGKLCEQKTA